MASPFNIFRKRQRAILVVVGVICIFTFTIGEIILNWFGPDTAVARSETVVTWKGGQLTETDLGMLRGMHNLTVAYLDQVVSETMKRDGTPKGAGVTQNRQGQVVDPGISRDASELRIVRTMLLAEKAEKLGMEVPDEAIYDFLAQLSDRTLSSEELRGLLQGATHGRLTRDQLFETLRRELLARNYLRLVGAGDVMTPDDAWNYYNRLTRRVSTSMVAFRAEDFLDDAPQPSQKQVQEFFDKHKDQFPNPASPEPGFKQRAQFEFAYFKADYDKFMEEEKAKISAEEVQKYYDENKENYKVPELPGGPGDNTETEAPGTSAAPTDPAAATPADAAAPENPDAAVNPEPAPSEAPAPNEPSDAEGTPPAEAAPASEPPASEGATDETPDAAPAETTEGNDASDTSNQESRRRGLNRATPVFFASAQEETTSEEPETPAAEPTDNEPASNQPASEQPAAPQDDTPAPSTETSPEPSAETPPAEQPASEEPAAEDAAPGQPEGTQPAGAPNAETKYQPLEQVEDDIRRTLASPVVRERMDKALKEAERVVQKYGRSYKSFLAQTERGAKGRRPEPPNFKNLAQELGLTFGRTPLVDELSVGETELGQTFTFGPGFQQISFAQIAMQNEELPLYQTARISSGLSEFLFWATQVKASATPSLDEIRDEVIRAWRMQKAFDLARAAAEKAAVTIGKGSLEKPLHEAAGVKEAEVIRPSAFSWMSTGAVPFGGGSPSLSSVEGVENAGQDFMEAVFTTPPGGIAVAPNQSKDAVYVVRIEEESPGEDIRRDLFWQSGVQFNFNLQYVAQFEQQRKIFAWLDELEKEWQLDWKRPPREMGMM